MYGERNTFEDARTTVTEFLDDFYDESEGNFNQAFLNLERRLQEYFGYEPRDTENGPESGPEGGSEDGAEDGAEYVVYMDGAEWGRFSDRSRAEALVESYCGEREVWIEEGKKE